MKLKPLQKYEIFWIDIEVDSEKWYTVDDIKKLIKSSTTTYRNLGYYLGENKDYLFFTQGLSNDSMHFDYVKYPKGCVKKVVPLKN